MTAAFLPYGRQSIDDSDVAEVVRVLRSDYLTTGPEIEAFEAELAQACGARHAVVVANGTAALHCAYAAAELAAGHEVITTPLTFSATANMVVAMGATPVFADVRDDTLCLDPDRVAAAITPRTRAIAAVDYAGHPAEMDRLMGLAREHDLLVIEDASHSIGGRYKQRPVGSLAHLTTFSFHPVKTITTGEGGAVLTDDSRLAERARDFRNHGLVRDKQRLCRQEGSWYYEIQSLGFNYRLTAIQCALGRSQLKRLPAFVARRAELVARYRRAFAAQPRLTLMTAAQGVDPAWHLFAIRVNADDRPALFDRLVQRGIGAQVHYIAVNDLPLYRRLGNDPASTPIAWQASRQLLSLPLFPGMNDADADRVIFEVNEALRDEA